MAPAPGNNVSSYRTYGSTQYSETLFKTSSETRKDQQNEGPRDTTDGEGQSTQSFNEYNPLSAYIFKLFRDLDSSDTKQPWYVTFLPCLKLKENAIEENYTMQGATKRLHDILTAEKMKATFEFTEYQLNAPGLSDQEGQKAKTHREILEAKRSKLNTLTTLHKLLDLQLDLQWRRQYFVDMLRLQKTLTYLTYVVFVLNSFITGFGLTDQNV